MNNQGEIKTLKYIKRTIYVSLLYVLFCFISIMAFAAVAYQRDTYHDFNTILFGVGLFSVYLWMTNPMVLVVSAIGFTHYLKERKDLQKRSQIGTKWLVFVLCSVGSAVVWMASVVLFVLFTGGV